MKAFLSNIFAKTIFKLVDVTWTCRNFTSVNMCRIVSRLLGRDSNLRMVLSFSHVNRLNRICFMHLSTFLWYPFQLVNPTKIIFHLRSFVLFSTLLSSFLLFLPSSGHLLYSIVYSLWANPGLFLIIFGLFKQTIQF